MNTTHTTKEPKDYWMTFLANVNPGDLESENTKRVFNMVLDSALQSRDREIVGMCEKEKQFPRVCPHCFTKLEIGFIGDGITRYGCYSKDCQKTKAYDYFHVDLTAEKMAWYEGYDQALSDLKDRIQNHE